MNHPPRDLGKPGGVPSRVGFLFLELTAVFLRFLLGFRRSEPGPKSAESASGMLVAVSWACC